MKKLALFTLFNLLVLNFTFGQDRAKYDDLVKEAKIFYKSKEYLKSGKKYSEAFAAFGNKGIGYDRYNAACSWALANKIDSAFVQLFKTADSENFTDLNNLITDADLASLHKDKRWTKVVEIVKSNKEKAEAKLDKSLITILDAVYREDQQARMDLDSIGKKYGWKSEKMKAQWEIANRKDSINLKKVKKILDERGWLGADVIGYYGNLTLFLVIQHADFATLEKYLPMMREAVKKGNAMASNLALLEDRVAIWKGGKQIYGSQIAQNMVTGEPYVLPLIDPDNVDKRRAEVGLPPMQDYLNHFGMVWDVKEYKKKLSEEEVKQKK